MRLQPKIPTAPDYEVIIFSLITTIAVGSYTWLKLFALPLPNRCVLSDGLGIPCPLCGGTRSTLALMDGNLTYALAWNPLAVLIILTALAACAYSAYAIIFRKPRWRLTHLTKQEGRRARIAAITLILANWLYLIIAHPQMENF